MTDTRMVLNKLGYKMKSREREQRSIPAELALFLERFCDVLKVRSLSVHMPKVVLFALFSTR